MAKPKRTPRHASFLARARANFLTGLVVVAPIGLTLYLTLTIVEFVDSKVLPLIPAPYNPRTYIDGDIPGLGVVIFLVFTALIGYLAKKVFGKQVILYGEQLVDRTPVIRSIYNALKQIVETMLNQTGTSYSKACLVEYPRAGVWTLGLVAADTTGEIDETAGPGLVTVFVPTAPNPTSGYLIFVPRADLRPLQMSVEEALKMVVSAGLVTPPSRGPGASVTAVPRVAPVPRARQV